jgi:hypothetical protein
MKKLNTFLFIIVGGIFYISLIDYSASIPTLYQSIKTGLCVYVDDPLKRYSCERRPQKFIHKWVK